MIQRQYELVRGQPAASLEPEPGVRCALLDEPEIGPGEDGQREGHHERCGNGFHERDDSTSSGLAD